MGTNIISIDDSTTTISLDATPTLGRGPQSLANSVRP